MRGTKEKELADTVDEERLFAYVAFGFGVVVGFTLFGTFSFLSALFATIIWALGTPFSACFSALNIMFSATAVGMISSWVEEDVLSLRIGLVAGLGGMYFWHGWENGIAMLLLLTIVSACTTLGKHYSVFRRHATK